MVHRRGRWACGYEFDSFSVARELVVGRCRVTLVEFRYFARFQDRFLVIYRLNTNEKLMRSSFVGEPSVLNVSPS